MNFSQLLHGAEILAQSGNASVSGLEYDSRRVKPGDAFIAMHGETSDGNKFIDKAIAAGAVAVITDAAIEPPREEIAWVQSAPRTPRTRPTECAIFTSGPPSDWQLRALPARMEKAQPPFCWKQFSLRPIARAR